MVTLMLLFYLIGFALEFPSALRSARALPDTRGHDVWVSIVVAAIWPLLLIVAMFLSLLSLFTASKDERD